MRIIIDAASRGRLRAEDAESGEDANAATVALAPIRAQLPPGIPAAVVQRGLMVWTGLFGVVSFELYGQLHQVVGDDPADRAVFFAECIRRWIAFMGLE